MTLLFFRMFYTSHKFTWSLDKQYLGFSGEIQVILHFSCKIKCFFLLSIAWSDHLSAEHHRYNTRYFNLVSLSSVKSGQIGLRKTVFLLFYIALLIYEHVRCSMPPYLISQNICLTMETAVNFYFKLINCSFQQYERQRLRACVTWNCC